MEYKDTLNLPLTDFPMKANLNQREPEMLAKWEAAGLYSKLEESRQQSPPIFSMTALLMPTAISISVTPSTRFSRTLSSRASGWKVSMPPMCRAGTATACRSNCRWRRISARKNTTMSKLEMRKECRDVCGEVH